jgi:hypothetical protein
MQTAAAAAAAVVVVASSAAEEEEELALPRLIVQDTARAIALDHDAHNEAFAVTARFRAALRSGAPEQLRAFMARDGYRLGNAEWEGGFGEHVALDEALRDEAMPLEMIGLFFRELGGRFIVSSRFVMCVFSLLIQIDNERWVEPRHPRNAGLPMDDDAAARWAARMAELVRYLVEEEGLQMPIRMPHRYRARAWGTYPLSDLMDLARTGTAWAAYCAFGQYLIDADIITNDEGLLMRFVLRFTPAETVGFWARRLGIETLSDEALQGIIMMQRDQSSPEARAVLAAESARRAAVQVHMRALLMLPAANAPGRAALQDSFLAQYIQSIAWADAPF